MKRKQAITQRLSMRRYMVGDVALGAPFVRLDLAQVFIRNAVPESALARAFSRSVLHGGGEFVWSSLTRQTDAGSFPSGHERICGLDLVGPLLSLTNKLGDAGWTTEGIRLTIDDPSTG